jgi:hypothetical protein
VKHLASCRLRHHRRLRALRSSPCNCRWPSGSSSTLSASIAGPGRTAPSSWASASRPRSSRVDPQVSQGARRAPVAREPRSRPRVTVLVPRLRRLFGLGSRVTPRARHNQRGGSRTPQRTNTNVHASRFAPVSVNRDVALRVLWRGPTTKWAGEKRPARFRALMQRSR